MARVGSGKKSGVGVSNTAGESAVGVLLMAGVGVLLTAGEK